MKQFNEATRVQMPAMVYLTRIGYTYFGKLFEEMNGTIYDGDTNILLSVFKQQFNKLNPGHEGEYLQVLKDIKKELNDDDLGRGFYNRLKSVSPVKLIDFDNIQNNSFHFTAEFTCKNGQDEFRPDITLFVNGLPLCFIEVKRPNNQGGMLAESARMNKERFPNKKFRRFINITQLMIFSNNMEYDALGGIVPIQGAFYCTSARSYSPFNCFREENLSSQKIAPFHCNYLYKDIDEIIEKQILSDYNCQVIHTSPEYQTNLGFNTPTNRILTSMCSPERLLYIIRYGIAYVKMEREIDGKIESTDQKHIMRYQQLFASLAIRKKLSESIKSGVVWHTQGSGKTALSYYLTYILNDFYSKQNKVAKFYFIVDRLDLLEQATQEFEARGLIVGTANTRTELMEQFRNNQAQQGASGQAEITVVNIQRFAEDKEKVRINDYATNLQRIFILDEAHRGYKPGGCFLANLFEADENAVKIALTGTPLLKEERASCMVFGDYLHTYYYDKSIADGYTLKIIREDIETSYKERLSDVYDKLDTLVQKKDIRKSEIIEHPSYVKELARYIINDLKEFRKIQGDDKLGSMVICETSEQARRLFDVFQEEWQKYQPKPIKIKLVDGSCVVGEPMVDYKSQYRPLKAGIILYDTDDKETRKQIVKDFKKNMTIDILIVFNMLLTGFDAPRLKRLYFGRKPLFEPLTSFVTDTAQRAPFARALVDKLVNFSFEEAFAQNYDFFSSIFEYLIKDYNTAGGGKYAEYYTPHAIATIMARLLVGDSADLHNIECYDPSAGTGTLLMALSHQIGEDRCTIFSQDISQRSNKMLKLNLLLNGLVSSLDNAIQGDTLVSPYHKSDDGQQLRQFDFVVSNPPFKMDFSDTREKIAAMPARFWAGVPNVPAKKKESMTIYTCFIQHVINSLKKNGKGAIVIPTGFITAKSGIENKILNKIVDNKIVFGCVSMPSNVFANTGTNVSVLFFDKSATSEKVILIDASKLGEEYKDANGLKKVRLNNDEIEKIVGTFQRKEAVDDFSVAVTYDEIKKKGYSLSAGQYFDIKIEYVNITEEEFNARMDNYKSELTQQFAESHRLEEEIMKQLNALKFNANVGE